MWLRRLRNFLQNDERGTQGPCPSVDGQGFFCVPAILIFLVFDMFVAYNEANIQ